MKKHLTQILFLTLLSTVVLGQDLRVRGNPVEVDFSDSRSLKSIADPALVEQELRVTNLPVYHALIIGISDYKFSGPLLTDLNRPVKDAQKFYEILTSKYYFPKEHATLLLDPTREAIIDQFDKLTRNVGEKDNLLIFYAGHGYYERSTDFGFWLPTDAKPDSRSNWIANSTIKDYMKAIPSKHTLLITDACFAGSIFKARDASNVDTRKIYELYKEKSRKAITSGNLSQVPDESYFLNFLLKILSENEQDFLPSSALFSRIFEPVMNNSPTIPQYSTVFGAGDEGGDFIFLKRN